MIRLTTLIWLALASLAGVGLFAATAHGSGVVAMAWGLALNGAVSAGSPWAEPRWA